MSNRIIKDIVFESDNSLSECKKLTIDFFKSLGFKNPRKESNSIQYKRGSELQNGFTTNPLKWMSLITLEFKEGTESIQVNGNLNINTKNQLVTEKELDIWNSVCELFEYSLKSGKVKSQPLLLKNRQVKKRGRKAILWAVTGMIIGGGLGTFLGAKTGFTLLIPILTILGAIIFLILGLQKNK